MKIKYDEINYLEKLATSITGIKPITNREYCKLYYKITNKHHNCRKEQIRGNIFKTTRKKI